jgi:hypothetical protein
LPATAPVALDAPRTPAKTASTVGLPRTPPVVPKSTPSATHTPKITEIKAKLAVQADLGIIEH